MAQTEPQPQQVYRHRFTVPESALDQNGHVNNVVYIQWMQDVATLHFNALGGAAAMQKAGATWVVNFRRVRSLRRYRFLREDDGVLLARGETDWVFVDAASGRPCRIPDEMIRLLPLSESG